jgi:hypothetical protein
MKILYLQKVDDPISTVKAIFAFEHNGIEFHGWKIVEGEHTDAVWLATPRIKIFPGSGATPIYMITVRMPAELQSELRDLILAEYEKLTGSR